MNDAFFLRQSNWKLKKAESHLNVQMSEQLHINLKQQPSEQISSRK